MIAVERFLAKMRPHCPGVSDLMLKAALDEAISEFCGLSLAYQADLEDLSCLVGETDYELDAVPGKTLLYLMRVTKDGKPFTDFTFDLFTFRLNTEPTAAFTLSMRGAFRPATEQSSYDDVFGIWLDGIVSGALARLFAQPGKQWTEGAAVSFYDSKFRSAVNRARINQNQQFSGKSLVITPRRFM